MEPSKAVKNLYIYYKIKEAAFVQDTMIVISNTGIFVEIANNTLYESKLYIFLLCQKSLGY